MTILTVMMTMMIMMISRRQYDLSLSLDGCALTRAVQYCLDRLYISRISLNMLTNQHLMLHGYKGQADTIKSRKKYFNEIPQTQSG